MQELILSCCCPQLYWSSRSCTVNTGARKSLEPRVAVAVSHWSPARALPMRMHAEVPTLMLPSPFALEPMLVYCRSGPELMLADIAEVLHTTTE